MSAFVSVILASIMPLRVIPNKITYPEGEKGWIDVVVTNTASSPQSATIRIDEKWGIEGDGRKIWEDEVEVGAAKEKKFRVEYPGSDIRYGHEVRATVLHDKTNPSKNPSRAEYFCVNDEWWRVNQGCGMEFKKDSITPLYRQYVQYYGYPLVPAVYAGGMLPSHQWEKVGWDNGPFAGYTSMITRWQMQKASVGGNKAAADMPDGVKWRTANGSMCRDSGEIRKDTEVCHNWGVHHTRFTIDYMEGPYGFELARKNPEFMLRNDIGGFAGRWKDAQPEQIAKFDNPRRYPWTYVEPNFYREDVIDWALADLQAGVDGFNEDGVYFDGRYFKKHGYDAFGNNLSKTHDVAATIVRNMEKTHKVLLDNDPNRFSWSNGPNPRLPETKFHSHPRGGLLKELQWPFLLPPSTMNCSNYRGFYEVVMSGRNIVYIPSKYVDNPSKVYMVGYLCPAWTKKPSPDSYRECWTMAQHIMAIVASSLAHPFADGVQMRNFKQMMERYAEFYWHEDIEVMRDGYKRFICDSLRSVWYDETIYTRKGKGYRDYYIHLVNEPESEQCREDVEEDAPEVDDAEVSTKLFGPEKVKAWVIKPYEYMDKVLEPKQCEIEIKTVKNETVFSIPPFKYYSLLIIRKYE